MRATIFATVLVLAGAGLVTDARAWDGEQTVGDWLMTGIGAPDDALTADGDAVAIEKTAQASRELQYVGFLAGELKRVPTTTNGFIHCELTMQVPAKTKWILYGYTYRGAGRAWVR